jgi:hypothetical protein
MKHFIIILIASTLLFSCKKKNEEVTTVNPLVGNWYIKANQLSTPTYVTTSSTNNIVFDVNGSATSKTLVNIEAAGEGKYYISIAGVAGKTLDYNQINNWTYLELLPRTNVPSQQFTFEKVSNSTDVYYIKSASNPDKYLTGFSGIIYVSIFSTLKAPNSSNTYIQHWKLEK